jgi:hypothetical protein
MTRSVIVATPKGGVGKTALASVLVAALNERGRDPHVVDVDIQGGSVVTSLCTVYTDATQIAIAPTMEEVINDANVTLSHWDKLYRLMVARDTVIDFGANVIDNVFTWAATSGIAKMLAKEGVQLDFVVPMTANVEAAQKTVQTLSRAQEVFAGMGSGLRLFLAFNFKDGAFEKIENDPALLALTEGKRVIVTRFERAVSEIWIAAEKRRLSPLNVLSMSEADMMRDFQLDEMQVTRGLALYRRWFEKCVSNFEAVGLVPPASEGLTARPGAGERVGAVGGTAGGGKVGKVA